jgi:hypothetical protein
MRVRNVIPLFFAILFVGLRATSAFAQTDDGGFSATVTPTEEEL